MGMGYQGWDGMGWGGPVVTEAAARAGRDGQGRAELIDCVSYYAGALQNSLERERGEGLCCLLR